MIVFGQQFFDRNIMTSKAQLSYFGAIAAGKYLRDSVFISS